MADEKKETKAGGGKGGGKPGRKPKAPQTMPLILSETRNRVLRELMMDAETSALVESYSTWAAKSGGISKDEAVVLLLAKAVPAFIKRDVLFTQESLKVKHGKDQTKGAAVSIDAGIREE